MGKSVSPPLGSMSTADRASSSSVPPSSRCETPGMPRFEPRLGALGHSNRMSAGEPALSQRAAPADAVAHMTCQTFHHFHQGRFGSGAEGS